ncbi:glycoside hydrolase superfamily [Geopyxis carbonaria]|nr:glycoside hydrolase superfamily [Geopyxis carbonaria]
MLQLLSLVLAVAGVASATNARTSTPPMGWNTYNHYNCFVTEAQVKANAKALVDLGLASVGYNYVVPDCGWSAADRTSDGKITWNTTYYPSGFPALGTYIHGLNLKFGIYSGAGPWQCNPTLIQASLGNEDVDAATFASWGGDYLKYDNCWANGKTMVEYYPTFESDPSTRFRAMAAALEKVTRPMVYGICQWGIGEHLGDWAPEIGNNWRMSNDITNAWNSIWRITNQVVPLSKYSSPGHYNDMDMLMIGNGVLTAEESRTHFSIWCIQKSPLFIGAALENNLLDATALGIFLNKDLVAINQDSLGTAATLRYRAQSTKGYEIWSGPLSGSRTVVAIVNWANAAQSVTVPLSDIGIATAGAAHDVWAKSDIGALSGSYTSGSIPAHGTKLLILSNTTPAAALAAGTLYSAKTATLAGGAALTTCPSGTCAPVGAKITGLNATTTTATWTVSSSSAGTKRIELIYTNYDLSFDGSWSGDAVNTVDAYVSVNGAAEVRWELPIAGGDWNEAASFVMDTAGWKSGSNTLRIRGVKGYSGRSIEIVGVRVRAQGRARARSGRL